MSVIVFPCCCKYTTIQRISEKWLEKNPISSNELIMKKRKEMTNRFIQTKLDEIVSKYVENNLNEHGTTKTGKGDSTKDLIAAIQDRCDYQVGDIPVSYIFDYTPEYKGAADSNSDFVRNLVWAFKNNREAWMRYSDQEYQFYKHIAECLYSHEINRMLDGLNSDNIKLVPVPAHSKIDHLNRWWEPLLGIVDHTGLVGHIGSFIYAQEEGKKPSHLGGAKGIPDGRFERKCFSDGNKRPHVILLDDIITTGQSIRETADKLRNEVGAKVVGTVVLAKTKAN